MISVVFDKILCESKANLDKQDKYGDTALTWAIYNDYTECAKLLIEGGVNLELPQHRTPLDYALSNENLEIIFLLLCNDALTTRPVDLVLFLQKQGRNNKNTYGGFFILYEQQEKLRKTLNPNNKLLLDDKHYNEIKNYLATLPYLDKSIPFLKTQVISAIDDAINNYFPSVITNLVSQYDNQLYRLFTPKSNRKNNLSEFPGENIATMVDFSAETIEQPTSCCLIV